MVLSSVASASVSLRNVLRNAISRAPDLPGVTVRESQSGTLGVGPHGLYLTSPQRDVGLWDSVSISDLERQRDDITQKQSFGNKIMISRRNKI